jgi:hypothetical protein
VITVALAAGAALLWLTGRDDAAAAKPDVVLGSGTFMGRQWTYGFDVWEFGPCFQLVIDGSSSGCGTTATPPEPVVFYTRSGGTQHGLVTAEGLVSEEVERVTCSVGGRATGESHLFEMREKGPRPVLCLAGAGALGRGLWVATAYDERGRPIGIDVL